MLLCRKGSSTFAQIFVVKIEVRNVGFIKSNPDVRELKRGLAVKMAIEEYPYQRITQLLGVSSFCISDWKKKFKANGTDGIRLGHKGSRKYLTDAQLAEVVKWLSNQEY